MSIDKTRIHRKKSAAVLRYSYHFQIRHKLISKTAGCVCRTHDEACLLFCIPSPLNMVDFVVLRLSYICFYHARRLNPCSFGTVFDQRAFVAYIFDWRFLSFQLTFVATNILIKFLPLHTFLIQICFRSYYIFIYNVRTIYPILHFIDI
jgi:hypothetical protein